MDELMESSEMEANELLDETQRLRHKRDLLTKENEQLKSYLRLRQMESTATCEQLKSEIEQQIEQFEALGDTETNHLETLKSFRSEIEAIQCWNAKIRNKYFSRNSCLNFNINDNSICFNNDNNKEKSQDQVLDNQSSSQLLSLNNDNQCFDNQLISNNSNDSKDSKLNKSIGRQIRCKSKPKPLQKVHKDLTHKKVESYNIITRSQLKSKTISNKRKNRADKSEKKTKRKK